MVREGTNFIVRLAHVQKTKIHEDAEVTTTRWAHLCSDDEFLGAEPKNQDFVIHDYSQGCCSLLQAHEGPSTPGDVLEAWLKEMPGQMFFGLGRGATEENVEPGEPVLIFSEMPSMLLFDNFRDLLRKDLNQIWEFLRATRNILLEFQKSLRQCQRSPPASRRFLQKLFWNPVRSICKHSPGPKRPSSKIGSDFASTLRVRRGPLRKFVLPNCGITSRNEAIFHKVMKTRGPGRIPKEPKAEIIWLSLPLSH